MLNDGKFIPMFFVCNRPLIPYYWTRIMVPGYSLLDHWLLFGIKKKKKKKGTSKPFSKKKRKKKGKPNLQLNTVRNSAASQWQMNWRSKTSGSQGHWGWELGARTKRPKSLRLKYRIYLRERDKIKVKILSKTCL